MGLCALLLHVSMVQKAEKARDRLNLSYFHDFGALKRQVRCILLRRLYYLVFSINILHVLKFLKTLESFPNKNIKIFVKGEIISVQLRY